MQIKGASEFPKIPAGDSRSLIRAQLRDDQTRRASATFARIPRKIRCLHFCNDRRDVNIAAFAAKYPQISNTNFPGRVARIAYRYTVFRKPRFPDSPEQLGISCCATAKAAFPFPIFQRDIHTRTCACVCVCVCVSKTIARFYVASQVAGNV